MERSRRRVLQFGVGALVGGTTLASTGTRTGMAASVEAVEDQITIEATDTSLGELAISTLDLTLEWQSLINTSNPVDFDLGVRINDGDRQRIAEGSISLGGQKDGSGSITNSGDAPTWETAPWDDSIAGDAISLLSGEYTVNESFETGNTYNLEFDFQFTHDDSYVTASDTASIELTIIRALTADASVEPQIGTIDDTYTFDASGTTSPEGSTLTYEWEFSDGTTKTGTIVDHQYDQIGNYNVTLTTTDSEGDQSSETITVTVENRAPTADISVNKTTATYADEITFDGSQSTDADGHSLTYEWDFGDETTAAGATATHSFESSGTYTVGLTVYDDNGGSDTAEREITIENPAPTAVANANTQTIYLGNTVEFDATESSDPLGQSLTYEWDFDGDGNINASGETSTYVYENVGDYTVTLTVTDDGGKTATDTVDITVNSLPDSKAFGFTKTSKMYDVSGISTVRVKMDGAGGESGGEHYGQGTTYSAGSGSVGGHLEVELDVSEFDSLDIWVGGGNGNRWGRANGGKGDSSANYDNNGGNGAGSTEIWAGGEFLAAADGGGGGSGGGYNYGRFDKTGRGGGGGGRGGSGGANSRDGYGAGNDAEGDGFGGDGGDAVWEQDSGNDGEDGGVEYNEEYTLAIHSESKGGGNSGNGRVHIEPLA